MVKYDKGRGAAVTAEGIRVEIEAVLLQEGECLERSAIALYRRKGFYLFQGLNDRWSVTILPVESGVSEQIWISIKWNSGFRADSDLYCQLHA